MVPKHTHYGVQSTADLLGITLLESSNMGGCRCSYRNCTLRTDGKTHMFHYPVFDKVRCHQWLTNARKLEFLYLKVSQLKNRVVCQHHFKDDNFMNFKKDKLTFDAVPTEDGPYCDSSQLSETRTEQEESKGFSISLDDIENEYLTIVDKKANFSVKYGDFLTNCDLMDLDSLNSRNQIDENNQIALKSLCTLPAKPLAPKDLIKPKRPVKSVRPVVRKTRPKRNTVKNKVLQGNNHTINHNNTIDISNLIETPQTKDQNSLNLVLKVSHVPIEFEGLKPNDAIQVNNDESTNEKALDGSRLLNEQSFEVRVLDEPNPLNEQLFEVRVLDEPKCLNEQSCDVKVYDEPKLLNEQTCDVRVLGEPKILNNQSYDLQVVHEPKPSNNYANKSSIKERKKIRIISEKKISEPVSLTGRLEPVSPTRILTFPNKRKNLNPTPLIDIPELPITNGNTEISHIVTEASKDKLILGNSDIEPMNILNSSQDNVSLQDNRNDAININQNEVLASKNASLLKTRTDEINKSPKVFKPKTSLLRNKIPPERVAAIEEKRRFNMKLRDIVEDCLDKLEEPDKTDFDNRKVSYKSKTIQSKKQQVDSYLAKDPQLPSVQDYTIAYLEARMKKMEDNLLNKIGENSQKIMELTQSVAPSCQKKSAHTQTSVNEDVHKKQLYKELSKYLSQEANSLIYEELFINKYTKEVPTGSSSPKRRRRR
ncbi:hypothetical protein PYW07_004426 [Mythimna separata]|uniref:THAP-type domain-containing protein n=1 Tax=Mythimna separata TaxID=271217 RepID=A0AAD8DYZ6_MYTSE|nr:hypothetical protein PYW07_004426 [Mythimna separata]